MKTKTYKILLMLFLLSILVLAGCSTISQDAAQAKAIQFVKDRVKFYSKNNESTINFPDYGFHSVNSYKTGNTWVVIIEISRAENQSKRTDVVVELDARTGDITKFNNQPVSNP